MQNKNNTNFIILTIVCIILTGFSLNYHLKKIRNASYQVNWPEFTAPNIESLLSQDNQECKKFISADKKLILNYCSDWMGADTQSLKMNLDQFNEDNDTKIVFLAQKIVIEKNALIRLVVREAYWDFGADFDKVIQKIQDNADLNEKIQIIKSNMDKDGACFEAIYSNSQGEKTHSIGKILFDGEQKYFLIDFFSQEKDKEILNIEADKILKSIEFNI